MILIYARNVVVRILHSSLPADASRLIVCAAMRFARSHCAVRLYIPRVTRLPTLHSCDTFTIPITPIYCFAI